MFFTIGDLTIAVWFLGIGKVNVVTKTVHCQLLLSSAGGLDNHDFVALGDLVVGPFGAGDDVHADGHGYAIGGEGELLHEVGNGLPAEVGRLVVYDDLHILFGFKVLCVACRGGVGPVAGFPVLFSWEGVANLARICAAA